MEFINTLSFSYPFVFNNIIMFLNSLKFCLKRRLRIRTLQFGPASNMNELYDSVDPEAALSILVHKVLYLRTYVDIQ